MNANALVLGLHPFARGFGWILLESPLAAHDWGVVEKKTDRNARCLIVIERLMDRYHPAFVALESYDRPPVPRAARIRQLCESIMALAQARNVAAQVYTHADIRAVFEGAVSRYAIATVIAQKVESIQTRLPKPRAIWESEHPNMALFNAAAAGIAHYTLSREGTSP